MKTCCYCKIEKPLSEFPVRSSRKSGYQPYCKECHNKQKSLNRNPEMQRNWDIKKAYGITSEDYDKILESQNGCCAVCGKHADELKHKRKKFLCIDHCHDTGNVRGLLCDSCNRGLGLLGDNPDNMLAAYDYLIKNGSYGK